MKRNLLFLFAISAMSSAHASFELALVLDVDHANTSANIKRFDVNTGAYLGSFGDGYITYSANNPVLTLDQANSEVYVAQPGSTILKFNYNTGEYLGEFLPINTVFTGMALQGASLISPWGGGPSYLIQMSTSGVYDGYYYGGSTAILRGAIVYNGYVFAPDSNNKQVIKWTHGALATTGTSAGSIPAWTSGYGWELEAQSGRLCWSDQFTKLIMATLNGAGNIVGTTIVDFASQGITYSQGLGKGHGDMIYLGGTNAGRTSGKVCRYNVATGSFRGTFGAGYLHDPSSIDVVLAPEPGVWMGTAFGIGLLAARRRRVKR